MKEMEVHLPAQPFTLENRYREDEAGGSHKKTSAFTILMARIFFAGNAMVFLGVVLGIMVGMCRAS